MIQHMAFVLPAEGDFPMVIGKDFVEVPCGCKCMNGLRADTNEAATVVIPCDPDEHLLMVEEFNARMRDSLLDPTDRPLIDVIEDMMVKLYEERVASGPSS
jgi:hypothetical protein